MSIPPTLVIMAAGASRRYGGLKQLAPVGPGGEALMEYSIYDAVRAGFEKVVLVVRREFEQAFRETFVDRANSRIEIAFAYQEPTAFAPADYQVADREKPWGTAHAVLCARPLVDGPFAVINADDFYGQSAFAIVARFLSSLVESDSSSAAMVGYPLQNTLSDHGSVNRGVCQVDDHGWLVDVVERFEITQANGNATYRAEEQATGSLDLDTLVSMNLWGFPAAMLEHLERGFSEFLDSKPDAATEYLLPDYAKQLMSDNLLRVQVLPTNELWCGMTYQQDLPAAQDRIVQLVDAGVYPEQLW